MIYNVLPFLLKSIISNVSGQLYQRFTWALIRGTKASPLTADYLPYVLGAGFIMVIWTS